METWLVSRLHLIVRLDDPLALETANQVDADLIEHGEGLLDESTLQQRWQDYVSHAAAVVTKATVSAYMRTYTEPTPAWRFYVIVPSEPLRRRAEVSPRVASRAATDAARGEDQYVSPGLSAVRNVR